jgi:hypothetical protein
MVSGQVLVEGDRKSKWRNAWMVVLAIVILAVGGSVYASSNREPSYDPAEAVFYDGHLYANFLPLQGVKNSSKYGKPVRYDTIWGPPTRAQEFKSDGETFGNCVGAGDKLVSFEPMTDGPYEFLICHKISGTTLTHKAHYR